MKFLIILLSLIAIQSSAAELKLNGGESAIIQANVSTTVTCGGNSSGTNCGDAVAGFKSKMKYCVESNSTSNCLTKLWGPYKQRNPGCIDAAFETCMGYCTQSNSSSNCLNICQ